MEEIERLRQEVEELQRQLRHETLRCIELERRCALLEKLAVRDPLTGLNSESYLHARVREEIERSIRYPAATSLVTLCVRQEQAEAMPRLGQRIAGELRATDQVFKLSDHGLALLLIETPEEGAHHVLKRLRDELEQFVKGFGYTVTTFPVHANLADDFIRLAMERHRELTRMMSTDNTAFSSQPVFVH